MTDRTTHPLARLFLVFALFALVFGAAACDDSQEETDMATEEDTSSTEQDTTEVDTETDTDEPETTTQTMPDVTEDDTEVAEEVTEPDVTESDADTTTADDVPDVADVPPGCGYGSIRGRVCSPRGDEWLSDVQVTVSTFECDNTPIVLQDFTDNQGFFQLDGVPEGVHSVRIETGSFTNNIEGIVVEAGKETDLTSATTKLCLDSRSAQIAVVTGVFDHIELLLDGLGIVYDLYAGDFLLTQFDDPFNPDGNFNSGLDLLLDAQTLLQYDIVIINSGEWYALFDNYPLDSGNLLQIRANLDAFIQSGGSLYVSDWAAYWIESLYPGAINFFGDPQNDAMGQPVIGQENSPKIGALDPDVPATVETEIFRNVVGENMTINFNWTAWVVAQSVSFESEVHVLATEVNINNQTTPTLPNVPMVISYQPTQTSGTVYFSAFHAAVQPTQQMEDVLKRIIFQL